MGRGREPGLGLDLAGCFGDVWALSDEQQDAALRTIGRPAELTASAKLGSLPEWARWREVIVSSLSAGGESGLALAREELAEDERIAATIYETQLHAHMGGQLFVRAVEVPEVGMSTPLAFSKGQRALDANGLPSFFRLSFREAVEAFLARDIVTGPEFQAMSAEMRARSFSATRLASQHLVERAQVLLRRFLEDGGTVDGFIAQMQAGEVSLGIEASTPWYLETVARTNVQTAYGQGRLRQMESPAVVSARPLVEYRTAGDGRVRPSHAALRGVVFDRTADPGWRVFAPPLGFNCRCAVVTRRESQIDRANIRSSAELAAAGLGPDDGWSGPGG